MVQLSFVIALIIFSIAHSAAVELSQVAAVSATTTTIAITTAQLTAYRTAELKKHNEYKLKHGCVSQVNNATLEKIAQAYATQLALAHKFAHSPGAISGLYGENLYWSWGYPTANYLNGTASTNWYSENVNYNYKTGTANPVGSTIGHFTAMIWNNTKTVGFGYAKVKEDRNITTIDPVTKKSVLKLVTGEAYYVVANYYAVPNVQGQYVKNVPPPK